MIGKSMRQKYKVIIGVALIGLIASVQAEQVTSGNEKSFSVRTSIGSAPGLDEGEMLGLSFPIDADTDYQLEVLAVKRFWSKSAPSLGGLLGGGIFYANNSGTDSDPDPSANDTFELSAFGVVGEAGVALKLGRHVVLETTPYLGAGGANVEITGFSDGTAPYFMYGVKGGIFVLLGDSFELGLEAGYHAVSSEVDLDMSNIGGPSSIDLTLEGDGARFAVVVGFKF